MIEPAAGILLIADPFLQDLSFMRSVVLLCRHIHEEGSIGFALHKDTELTINNLFNDMGEIHWPVYQGGPVQMDTLHFLHQYPHLLPDSIEVAENVYWGGDFEVLKELIFAGEIDEEKIKFFLGYSGWSAGQLDEEMKEKSWLTVPATSKIVFDTSVSEAWKQSLLELGGEYKTLIHYPTDPRHN